LRWRKVWTISRIDRVISAEDGAGAGLLRAPYGVGLLAGGSPVDPAQLYRADGGGPNSRASCDAELVRGGYIRVIITTNFDRLMENVLGERGIDPTVVASVDALV
jgi:hypothetical protein